MRFWPTHCKEGVSPFFTGFPSEIRTFRRIHRGQGTHCGCSGNFFTRALKSAQQIMSSRCDIAIELASHLAHERDQSHRPGGPLNGSSNPLRSPDQTAAACATAGPISSANLPRTAASMPLASRPTMASSLAGSPCSMNSSGRPSTRTGKVKPSA